MQASSSITVRCRFFARYAEIVGGAEFTLNLEQNATVAQAVAVLRQRVPNGTELPERPMVAVNQEHALVDRVLADGDEMALLPPLAGG
jgi:molybdopterin converting factor subunit 1